MPSSMIHLLTAYKIKPDASAEWWVGNISPDSGDLTREEKDLTHLRNLSNAEREMKLREMSDNLKLNDLYNEGKLLHLFTDYHWDITAFANYYRDDKSDYAFRNYRNEISIAGAWLYHTKEWSRDIWEMMANHDLTADERIFINRNYKWHDSNYLGIPTYYTPDFIEKFTNEIKCKYLNW